MLSLKKTYSFDELSDFIDNIENTFGKVSFCCEPKLDGVSVNLRYKNGTLESIINTLKKKKTLHNLKINCM
jgi:DNA ligase (NAD+)